MPIKLPSFRARRDVYPPDLWTKCPTCSTMLFNKQLDKACGSARRAATTSGCRPRRGSSSCSTRHVGRARCRPAVGRSARVRRPEALPGPARRGAAGDRDARRGGVGHGAIGGTAVAMCVMDFGFMGGSMGAVVGEKVTRAAEHALAERVPLIVVSASGGARMQEGTLALMQLAKTVAAIERLRPAGVPFISVLSDPTTGGVFASFAALGDVNIAEPNALIGFAGARVSAGTIAAGAAARVPALRVPVRARLRRPRRGPARAARRAGRPAPAAAGARVAAPGRRRPTATAGIPAAVVPDLASPTGSASWRRRWQRRRDDRAPAVAPTSADGLPARRRPDRTTAEPRRPRPRRVWARVQLARNLRRPRTLEFVAAMADEFIELHGDRLFGDDAAIVAGLARIDGRRVVVIGQQKGAETEENIRRNFGMPHPEGYRKAMRVDGARRALRPAGRHVRRHARAPTRARVRGARHRRGHRPLDRADDPPAHADRQRHHRRGRIGWRAGDRRR